MNTNAPTRISRMGRISTNGNRVNGKFNKMLLNRRGLAFAPQETHYANDRNLRL